MWTLGGVRIIVQNRDEEIKKLMARLQPLAGGTIHHLFGYEDKIVKLSAYVVGDTDKDALTLMSQNLTTTYVLSGLGLDLGDYYLSEVTFKQIQTICQTIRPDLDSDSPVYATNLNLFLEV